MLPAIYAISVLDALSFALVISSTGPYVYQLEGTDFFLGVLGSFSAFITLFWSPIMGSLSDNLGRNKTLVYSLLVCFVGNFLTALTSSLSLFFISRVLTTFGSQIVPILKSLIGDSIKSSEQKMTVIGKMQAYGGFCFISGALISGTLSEYQNGYKYVFYLISALNLINLVIALLLPDNNVNTKKQKPSTFSFTGELQNAAANLTRIDWPKYWDLFTIKLMIDFAFGVFQFTFGQIVMKQFGMKGKSFGYVIASMSIISIVTSLVMSKLKSYLYKTDDSGLKRLLHGCLLMLYTCLGQGLSSSFAMFFIHIIPIGIVRVLFESTFTEVILSRAGEKEKGSVMGAFETTLSFGGLTAPIFSGIVSEKFGTNASILSCVGPLMVGAIIAYRQKQKTE